MAMNFTRTVDPVEAVMHALLAPDGLSEASHLPIEVRRAAAYAVLTAYHEFRRGEEKLQEVSVRVGIAAMLDRARQVAAR